MNSLDALKQQLKPGQVYRRAELAKFSNSSDRHLRQLVDAGELQKLWNGVYYRPKKSIFGYVPPDEKTVVAAFLMDKNFLLTSLNAYNSLGVGTTQLYNAHLVYNHKRGGQMVLDGQKYYFLKDRRFPKRVTETFLLVDIVNNIQMLAEDRNEVIKRVAKRVQEIGLDKVRRVAKVYGKVATKNYFEQNFNIGALINAE